MEQKYPFKLENLPYAYDALEPYIDKETMMLHHDKHLKKYVDNLNNILKDYPKFWNWTLKEIIANIHTFPRDIQVDVRNNAGGVYNHFMYFDLINPIGANNETLVLKEKIITDFKSLENFFNQFKEAATKQFGSGYTFLVVDKNNNLKVLNMPNQDNPLELNLYPILLIDVWEHAYYLKYKNRRDEYIDSFMKLINWPNVEKNYLNYMEKGII